MAGTPEVSFYKDGLGEHRWRFVAGNGEIMAVSSEGYSSRFNAFRAWETIEAAIIEGADSGEDVDVLPRGTKDV